MDDQVMKTDRHREGREEVQGCYWHAPEINRHITNRNLCAFIRTLQIIDRTYISQKQTSWLSLTNKQNPTLIHASENWLC